MQQLGCSKAWCAGSPRLRHCGAAGQLLGMCLDHWCWTRREALLVVHGSQRSSSCSSMFVGSRCLLAAAAGSGCARTRIYMHGRSALEGELDTTGPSMQLCGLACLCDAGVSAWRRCCKCRLAYSCSALGLRACPLLADVWQLPGGIAVLSFVGSCHRRVSVLACAHTYPRRGEGRVGASSWRALCGALAAGCPVGWMLCWCCWTPCDDQGVGGVGGWVFGFSWCVRLWWGIRQIACCLSGLTFAASRVLLGSAGVTFTLQSFLTIAAVLRLLFCACCALRRCLPACLPLHPTAPFQSLLQVPQPQSLCQPSTPLSVPVQVSLQVPLPITLTFTLEVKRSRHCCVLLIVLLRDGNNVF